MDSLELDGRKRRKKKFVANADASLVANLDEGALEDGRRLLMS
jgi:hypothetical protein